MPDSRCTNCGYEMCPGMEVYLCDECDKDCCSECSEDWGAMSSICRECNDALPGTLAKLRAVAKAAVAWRQARADHDCECARRDEEGEKGTCAETMSALYNAAVALEVVVEAYMRETTDA